MRPRDLLDMVLLGAIWGGAFPLLRVATPAFGPVALIGVRVAVAAAVLLAVLRARGRLLEQTGPLFVLGMLNTAVPFTLFAYATLGVSAGTASLLNATTPMFGAMIAFLWLGELSRDGGATWELEQEMRASRRPEAGPAAGGSSRGYSSL